jgi:hypothetical protein
MKHRADYLLCSPHSACSFSHSSGLSQWFLNGKLNVSYNCVDRHVAAGRGDKVAILFEGDHPSDVRRITYSQLLEQVCKCANALKRLGVRKGDAVCIYMPMVPEAAVAMLACARLGAPHSIVFAGFSADALRDRIIEGGCRVVITADEGKRGGKLIPLKNTVDVALAQCPDVKHCLVYAHTATAAVSMKPGRDVAWAAALAAERGYAPCEWADSEDTLFMSVWKNLRALCSGERCSCQSYQSLLRRHPFSSQDCSLDLAAAFFPPCSRPGCSLRVPPASRKASRIPPLVICCTLP